MAPNLNTGKSWSEMDDADLRNSAGRGHSAEWIADFLCRDVGEVHSRAAELGLRPLPSNAPPEIWRE